MKNHDLFTLMLFPLFLIFTMTLTAQAGDIKTIAVVGFINQGDKTDNSVNKVISKSLITFLAKVKGTKVISYEVIEKLAEDNNFWESKELNVETASEMGLNLAVKQVVTGTYKIDNKKEIVHITVQVYDPATSELKLKRDYKGDAGTGIFDTIDRLIRNISSELVGHAVVMGNLEVEISSGSTYNLLINQIFQKKISSKEVFKETEAAEEPLVISLTIPETGREVFNDTVTLKDGENRIVTYSPSGSIAVRTGIAGIKVLADDMPAGETGNNGELIIGNLKAGSNHTVRIEKDSKNMGSKTILVEEGKIHPAEFIIRSLFFSIHAFDGGLGGVLGPDYYFTDFFRASLLVGAVYMWGTFVPEAEADIGFEVWKAGDFKIFATAGVFSYINLTASPIISPVARLEFSWYQLFIEGGCRYGLDDKSFNPMIGIGYRF